MRIDPRAVHPDTVTGRIVAAVIAHPGVPLAECETNSEIADRLRRETPGACTTAASVASVRSGVRAWFYASRDARLEHVPYVADIVDARAGSVL